MEPCVKEYCLDLYGPNPLNNNLGPVSSLLKFEHSRGIKNGGGSEYTGNPRFVYDGSDYVRFKRLVAKNKTYNDSSFGGASYQSGGIGTMWSHRHYSHRSGPTPVGPTPPQPFQCQPPPLKPNQHSKIYINNNNKHLIFLLLLIPNVQFVVTVAVTVNKPLLVDPLSTLFISSTGSIDLSHITYGNFENKLIASDIYNCGTLNFGDIIDVGESDVGDVGGISSPLGLPLNLTNKGTIYFGKIIAGSTGIGDSGGTADTHLNLINNGTIYFGKIIVAILLIEDRILYIQNL